MGGGGGLSGLRKVRRGWARGRGRRRRGLSLVRRGGRMRRRRRSGGNHRRSFERQRNGSRPRRRASTRRSRLPWSRTRPDGTLETIPRCPSRDLRRGSRIWDWVGETSRRRSGSRSRRKTVETRRKERQLPFLDLSPTTSPRGLGRRASRQASRRKS